MFEYRTKYRSELTSWKEFKVRRVAIANYKAMILLVVPSNFPLRKREKDSSSRELGKTNEYAKHEFPVILFTSYNSSRSGNKLLFFIPEAIR